MEVSAPVSRRDPTAVSAVAPRVLVVDDELPILDLVRGYLERDGIAVTVAVDGPAALAAARAESPDVVILDLMLPGIDGLEVCRQLRTFSEAYVLMLTARSEEIDRIIGLSVGADDYLVKPFSPGSWSPGSGRCSADHARSIHLRRRKASRSTRCAIACASMACRST